MKKVLVNIVLVGGIILSVMLSESNKVDDPIPDNSDSVQNKGEYIDSQDGNERAALKSVISWNESDGNDKYSLTVFPRGYRYEEFGHDAYNTFGYLDNWWSATKYNSNQSYFRGVYKGSHMRCIYPNKSFDLSARYVRN